MPTADESSLTSLPSCDQELCFQLLMQSFTDYAIFILDTDGRVAYWNAGAERLFGYTAEEITGEQFSVLFTPEDQEAGVPDDELLSASTTGRATDERWHRRKDGSRFWCSGITAGLKDEEGALAGFAKIARDLTERKQHQEEIERLNGSLRRTVSETHHRVKNNLQMLAALIEMQVMDHPESAPPELMRLGQHVRGLAVVHDLLTVGSRRGKLDVLSALTTLGRLLASLRTSLPDRRINVDIDDVDIPAKTSASLTILVNELVTNAAKHGEGDIDVTFTLADGAAHLEVCDRGPGFPEGFTGRDVSSMGLELVENIVRIDLQGKVEYGNRPEGGARVVVTFPLEAARQSP